MSTTFLWSPPPVPSLPVRGTAQRAPVNRLFFVGRNYHAHAVEMGRPVDKATERPFYFTKSPTTLVESGAKGLTIVGNNAGVDDFGMCLLLKTRQVSKVIASYVGASARRKFSSV